MEKSEIFRVQKYLRDTFRLDTITLRARPDGDETVDVCINDDCIGVITKDEEDEDISYDFNMTLKGLGPDIRQAEKRLRDTFRLDAISLQARPKVDDSEEVYIGDEFIGVVFKGEAGAESSYDFNMAILEEDLPIVAQVPED